MDPLSRPGYAFVSLAFAQRATAAFRAISLRFLGVNLAARASPPFLAPRRPKATAWGFFGLDMWATYLTHTYAGKHICLESATDMVTDGCGTVWLRFGRKH